ncbi:ABC transporter permease [Bifidobacterium crudilactis]|jgi:osmoprotectant transport system permease protein|uniref:ABC transporter permease n=1 Tax=Bifidobacterium crudilactis TaxID=327277 RepID=UPI00235244B7|nr:ABC transporter permease [Bifidobacterium crudilactis]MCI1218912.1 ABC transporter permease [Bifidobacterium crudilactis]MCI1637563.1 ABC transporter permease [Bifidobacterium crudilactis]
MWSSAYAWLTDPANWAGPESIPVRLAQHLGITLVAVLIAALIALPLGVVVGHVRRGTGFIGALTGAARAVPTLGLLTIVGLWIGIGITAPLVALVVLAVPSLLAGAYAGMQAVDPSIPEGAKAIGMSPLQVVFRVEIPLASPTIVGGIRAATLQVVATATLAAYTSDVGLGRFLFAGLKTRDYPMMLAAALLVVAVTVLLELVLAAIQRAVTRRYASA